jgi:DeoR/GlpR family transcriptional regulator of sugar metabolism
MLYIRDKSPITTRRSAGIPSLITGIISADPESALFKRVLEELLSEASLDVDISKFDESRIPQVHALNCIKDIFTTTKLVAASEAYLGRGLDLAATKLGSQL